MIKFAKYHGLGNDFIIAHEEDVKDRNYSELAINMCNRNTGIGADGFIVVGVKNGLEMIFYNADGTRESMCGNGIRCFAKYVYDEGIETRNKFPVITLAGVLTITVENTSPFHVKVNMGKPIFEPKQIPINKEEVINQTIVIDDIEYSYSSLFIGTTHTVVFVEDINDIDMINLGRKIMNHELFPKKTNVNFVQVLNKEKIRMQTYERGVGLTLACGTGACASVVIANLLNYTKEKVNVNVPLGTLNIELEDTVFMSGIADKICDGYFNEWGEVNEAI